MKNWARLVIAFAFALGVSCNFQTRAVNVLSAQDETKIRNINKSYVSGWLSSNQLEVLDLFLDDATIVPSGMAPKKGKNALKEFWFPNDGSETTIHNYDVEILDLQGSGNLAVTLERGSLSFSYKKGDSQISRQSQAHATTVYERQAGGEWKVRTRMWTDIK